LPLWQLPMNTSCDIRKRAPVASLLDNTSSTTSTTVSICEASKIHYGVIRWYEPVTGRWLSNDPIGISGGLNQYVAFENAPTAFRDPSGLDIYIFVRSGHISLAVQASWEEGDVHSWRTYDFYGTGQMVDSQNQQGNVMTGVISQEDLMKRLAYNSVIGAYRVKTSKVQDAVAIAEILNQKGSPPNYGDEGRCEKRSFEIVKNASGLDLLKYDLGWGGAQNLVTSHLDREVNKHKNLSRAGGSADSIFIEE